MKRWVSTIICDDIRHEAGNKLSYMGVYGPALYVPEIPIILPKLCFWISAHTTAGDPFKSLTFRVLKDTETILEAVVPKEDVERLSAPGGPSFPKFENDPVEIYNAVGALLAIAPYPVDRPHMLRVRVQTESEELRGVGLQVLPSSDASHSPQHSEPPK